MQISNIHDSIIVMKSIGTRFFQECFLSNFQKTRNKYFIGSKTTRLRLLLVFKHYFHVQRALFRIIFFRGVFKTFLC